MTILSAVECGFLERVLCRLPRAYWSGELVTFSPDGTELRPALMTKRSLWNVFSGLEVNSTLRHDGSVASVSFHQRRRANNIQLHDEKYESGI